MTTVSRPLTVQVSELGTETERLPVCQFAWSRNQSYKISLDAISVQWDTISPSMFGRRATLVFLFFGLLYTLTNSFRANMQIPDEEYVLWVTSRIVAGKPLHLPEGMPKMRGATDKGRDGKTYSAFQIGQSLLYVPFYFTARHLLAFSEPYEAKHGSRAKYETWLEKRTRTFLYFCPTLLAALSCALLFLFALRLGYSDRTALVLTLLYGLGTMVWPYSKYLLTEVSQNTLLLGTVFLLFRQRQQGELRKRKMIAAGMAFGLLLSIRAVFVVLLPVLAVYWFYRNRERRLVAPMMLFALPMMLWLIPQFAYDYIRFENTLSLGYQGASFSTPLYVGLYGFLFSSGKSFFLYTPVALLFFLGIRKFFTRAWQEGALFSTIMVIVLLKYAAWWVWSGDPCWGPRYLLVLTPFFILPIGEVVESAIKEQRLRKRVFIAGFFAVSFLVQVLAVAVHYRHYLVYVQQYATFIPPSHLTRATHNPSARVPIRDPFIETEFNPEYSPILGQWWVVKSLLSGNEEPGLSAPWSSLGYAKLHEKSPLTAKWDFWVIDLIRDGLHWANIRVILLTIALFIVFTIISQELFVSVFGREEE